MDQSFDDMRMRARVSKETPYLKRGELKTFFVTLYWATLVYTLASLATYRVAVAELVQAGAYFVMGVTSIRMGRCEKKCADLYYVAGAGQIFIGLSIAISWWIGTLNYITPMASLIAGIIMVIGLIASFVGFICEIIAYSKTMEEIDYTMSYKWKKYMKLYFALFGGIIAFVIVGFCVGWNSVFLIVLAIPLVVLALVIAVMKPAYLYKTAASL